VRVREALATPIEPDWATRGTRWSTTELRRRGEA
jgi:hypothetical protein